MRSVLMLIDTREPPPEPEGESPRRRWALFAWRRLRWFTVVCLLLVWSLATEGWPSLALAYVAILVSFWRGIMLMPTTGGMKDYRQ